MKFALYLFICIPLFCSSQQAATLTLQQANELAAKNYPLIRQREYIKQTAQLSIENIQKGFLPQVNINGQASYQSAVTSLPLKIPGINIETPSKDQYRVVADVSQVLYDGGLIQEQKTWQQINAAAKDQEIEVELQKLRERINQLFLSVLLTYEQRKQVALSDKDISAALKKVEAQVQNGTALRSNLNILKAELLKNEQRSIELSATRNSLLDVLSLFINQPLSHEVLLVKPEIMIPVFDQDIQRSELRLFSLQDSLLKRQTYLVNIKNKPRISLFAQAGYGRPGLNLLQNDFSSFAIGGLRFNWPLSNLYTAKKEKQLADIARRNMDVQKDNFLLNTRINLKQQQGEIDKVQQLIEIDRQIIELRTQVTEASYAQLQNGVLVASDYIREVNAADLARQSLALHQVQLLQAQLNYLTVLGKQ